MTLIFRALALFITIALTSAASLAQQQTGITVNAQGQAKGKPSLVELQAQIGGEAELTADAIVKYRDARKRALEAIENLKIPGLSIESEGFSVSQAVDPAAQQAMMRGMQAPAGKQQVSVTEKLRLKLVDVDKMEAEAMMDAVLKIIDTGRDAGLMIGPGQTNVNYWPPPPQPPMVAFKIPDPDALRAEAYAAAMKDARSKAEKLAALAGAKLGRVVSVSDATTMQGMPNPYYGYMPQASNTLDELSGGVFGDIPLVVKLTVNFELERGEATAKASEN